MKPSMAIKPLVFAIAAIMAVAAQASDRRDRDHRQHGPTIIPVSATATAHDTQNSTGNRILNEGTINRAEISNSASGTSGNVGINVASGSGNQQDNAAAIANSSAADMDNAFVFGAANATAYVKQYSNDNKVANYNTTASAVMSGSGNGGSGNMGINIAGGDLNQQKNTMAIANASSPQGGNSTATATADQNSPGLVVNNYADRNMSVQTVSLTTTNTGSASFSHESELNVDKSASSNWSNAGTSHYEASGSKSGQANSTSSATLAASADGSLNTSQSVTFTRGDDTRTRSAESTASFDATLNGSVETTKGHTYDSSFEKAYDSAYANSGESASASNKNVTKSYSESSAWDLSNTVSFQVLTPNGWSNPVTNTATLSGSVTGGSGNLGVNVAAGVGNQQSNSLAISNTSF
ncbi:MULTISPECIES: autotransporter outer membrane beta-barrel domain-containing protein [Pseudomonas]|uniref:Heme utilization protein n=1 Tax=Pseudomonas mosselii TaxID=78327 RepID=A0A5R8ZGU8_9PSED|nr:heme utilization protein [Pseudomonas mosselii]TLP64989.1 heme utilization protein [Pseudomonas mosselii]